MRIEMVGVKGCSGSGGRRAGSGRPRKVYKPIAPEHKPDSIKNVVRVLGDMYEWVLAREIDRQTAGTAIHALEVLAKIMMSSGYEMASYDPPCKYTDEEYDAKVKEILSRSPV